MSQKLNIPNLGTVLILTEDWEFNLYFEDRNQSLLDDYGYIKKFRWREEKKLKPADFKSGKIPQVNLCYRFIEDSGNLLKCKDQNQGLESSWCWQTYHEWGVILKNLK